MSQAVDLLNSLSGDDVVTYAANTEEEHIVVGNDRFIRIPDALKRLGVQHDKDIETVTFDCPRYWDKHDLSQMVIYVNYVLPNGEDGRYPVQNVVAIGKMLHFDWTISDYVTQYQGQISFLICAVTVDEEGNEKLHWNSELNQEAYISEGLECSESPIHKYPDIITHLLTRMDEVEAIATPEAMQIYTDTWLEENHARILAEIEAKGKATLDTIPEDYTETHNMAEESVRTKADAIVGTAEGTVISVADSSDDHIRNLRVFGKTTQHASTGANILNLNSRATFLNNNGAEKTGVCIPIEKTGTYTYYVKDSISVYIGCTNSLDSPATQFRTAAKGVPTLGTVSLKAGQYFLLWFDNDLSPVDTYSYFLAFGDNVAFEPYTNGEVAPSPGWPQTLTSANAPTIHVRGKNLLPIVGHGFLNGIGVEVTVANDGLVTAKGTSTGSGGRLSTDCQFMLPKGQYVVRAFDKDGNLIAANNVLGGAYLSIGSSAAFHLKLNTVFTVPETVLYTFGFNVDKDASYDEQFYICIYRVETDDSICAPSMPEQIATTTLRELNGVPVTSDGNFTDENGQQWLCDEIDFERGIYIQRVKVVECDGTETITREERSDGTYRFIIRFATPVQALTEHVYDGKCSHFMYGHSPIGNNAEDKMMCVWTTGNAYCRHDGITSEDDMVTWLAEHHAAGTPVTMIYPRAIPIETPLTAEEIEAFKALHTNYPHTTVLNDSGAHMELTYNVDTKTYVDNGIKQTVSEVMEAIANGSY